MAKTKQKKKAASPAKVKKASSKKLKVVGVKPPVEVIDLDSNTDSGSPSSDQTSAKDKHQKDTSNDTKVDNILPESINEEFQLVAGLKSQASKSLMKQFELTKPTTRDQVLKFFQEIVQHIQQINQQLLSPGGPLTKAREVMTRGGNSFSEALNETLDPRDALLVSYLALSQLLDCYTVIQALKGISYYDPSEKRKINEMSLIENLTRQLQTQLVSEGVISLEGAGRVDTEAAGRFVRTGLSGNEKEMHEV